MGDAKTGLPTGPGTGLHRLSTWLHENSRTWLKWCAAATGGLVVVVIATAAVWVAVLPQSANPVSVWIWMAAAAVYFAISAGLLLINATGHMPVWLAVVVSLGSLVTSIGVVATFFAAVLLTGASDWIAYAGIAVSPFVVIPVALALMWPMTQSLRRAASSSTQQGRSSEGAEPEN